MANEFEAPGDDLHNFMGLWWIPRISWREHLKQNHHVSFVKSEPTHCIRRVLGVWNWHLHCLLHVLVTNTSLGHNLRHVHHHLLWWESWSSCPLAKFCWDRENPTGNQFLFFRHRISGISRLKCSEKTNSGFYVGKSCTREMCDSKFPK